MKKNDRFLLSIPDGSTAVDSIIVDALQVKHFFKRAISFTDDINRPVGLDDLKVDSIYYVTVEAPATRKIKTYSIYRIS